MNGKTRAIQGVYSMVLCPAAFYNAVSIVSRAGVILRDSHGVAQVRYITGNKILRILKKKGSVFLAEVL